MQSPSMTSSINATSMATKEQHLAEAAHYETLASTLAQMGEAGWGVTLLFYAAVHLVQAYLVMSGPLPTSHAAREVMMQRDPALRPVERHYGILKKRSEISRYDCELFSDEDFANAQF